jgi:four helix bundle protein
LKSTEKIFCISRKYPQKAVAIFDITYYFVHTYLRWGDRTIDQMQQAARSGKQNIAEGRMDGATSKEMEIKLIKVAKASLMELYEDYIANIAICLLKQTDYLLAKHLDTLSKQFIKEK